MDAEKARKISREAGLEPLLTRAFERIEEFARRGKFSVPHPFHGAGTDLVYDVRAQEEAINVLREKGFKCVYHQNPDPPDPRSSDYWEVSW